MYNGEMLRNLRFVDAYIKGNEMWAMNMNFSAVFKINLNNYEVKYVSHIYDKEQIRQNYFSRNIIHKNNKLWIFPFKGSSIVEYDMDSEQMNFFTYNSLHLNGKEEIVNHWTIVYKEQAWIFPQNLISDDAPLLIYDLERKIYDEYRDWNQKLLEFEIYGEGRSITSLYHEENRVWFIVSGFNKLIEYNLENNEMHLYDIGVELRAVKHDGYNFWLLSTAKCKLLEWNEKQGIINQYHLYQKEDVTGDFSNLIIVNEKVVILPRNGEEIIVVDKKRNEITSIKSFPDNFGRVESLGEGSLIYGGKVYQDKLLLFPWGGNMLLELDLETYQITGHSLTLSERTFKESYIFPNMFLKAMQESPVFTLEDYLYFLGKAKKVSRKNVGEESQEAGKRIFEYILEDKHGGYRLKT